MLPSMAEIIPVSFVQSRLPRRLLRDGWWLETPPAHGAVGPFTEASSKLDLPLLSKHRRKTPHLSLVLSTD